CRVVFGGGCSLRCRRGYTTADAVDVWSATERIDSRPGGDHLVCRQCGGYQFLDRLRSQLHNIGLVSGRVFDFRDTPLQAYLKGEPHGNGLTNVRASFEVVVQRNLDRQSVEIRRQLVNEGNIAGSPCCIDYELDRTGAGYVLLAFLVCHYFVLDWKKFRSSDFRADRV